MEHVSDSEVGHSDVGEGSGEGHSDVGEGSGEGHSDVGEGNGEGHSGEDSTCSGTLEEDVSIMSSYSSELVNDSCSGNDFEWGQQWLTVISNDSTDDPLYPGSFCHSFNCRLCSDLCKSV